MNRYRYKFALRCPNNDVLIHYTLTIKSFETIMVEEIMKECELEPAYHEAVADRLITRFGGRQTLIANHHGVEIKTVRRST